MKMWQRYIKKSWTEKEGNQATRPITIRIPDSGTIKPEEANVNNLIGNLEDDDTQKGYIPFLIFLVIGMILQVTGNIFCVLAGTLVCVSVCGSICIWICVSAVLSHNK